MKAFTCARDLNTNQFLITTNSVPSKSLISDVNPCSSDAIRSCSNDTIANGRLANYKVDSEPGDSASLVCADGYATYNPHLTCGDDNTWIPTPICHKGKFQGLVEFFRLG